MDQKLPEDEENILTKKKFLSKMYTKKGKITNVFIMGSHSGATIGVGSKVSRITAVTFVISFSSARIIF